MTEQLPTAEKDFARTRACRATMLTARGRGAIATVVVTGPDAVATVNELFESVAGRPLDQFPCDRLVLGHWRAPFAAGDAAAGDAAVCGGEELVVCRRGADRIEIHGHGGAAAVDHVLGTLAAAGCPTWAAADWLWDQASDRLIAEARLALARARTVRVAAVLLDQYRGALSRAVGQVIQAVAAGRIAAAQDQLHTLLAWSSFGQRLITPWRIVLAGKTNAGKSSLLNALLGYPRALVDPTAGTTRDVLTAVTAVAGWPVELADTAGSRVAASVLESAGIARAARHVAAADLVLVVSDVSAAWSEEDEQWVRIAPHAPIIVHNKCDLVPAVLPDRPTGVATSAVTGAGLSELFRVVARRLVPQPPEPGTAIPFHERHHRGLSLALQALAERADDRARQVLGELIGTSP